MPIYTYDCTSCGTRFERFAKIAQMNDALEEPCPECGKQHTIKKVIVTRFERMAPDQLGRIKPPEDWRSFLSDLKRRNPGSDFDTY